MADTGDLPLLQDPGNALVWKSWDVTFRDVVILDAKNECYAVYNVSQNDLTDPANYATLKALFEGARNGEPSPGCP